MKLNKSKSKNSKSFYKYYSFKLRLHRNSNECLNVYCKQYHLSRSHFLKLCLLYCDYCLCVKKPISFEEFIKF